MGGRVSLAKLLGDSFEAQVISPVQPPTAYFSMYVPPPFVCQGIVKQIWSTVNWQVNYTPLCRLISRTATTLAAPPPLTHSSAATICRDENKYVINVKLISPPFSFQQAPLSNWTAGPLQAKHEPTWIRWHGTAQHRTPCPLKKDPCARVPQLKFFRDEVFGRGSRFTSKPWTGLYLKYPRSRTKVLKKWFAAPSAAAGGVRGLLAGLISWGTN